ncbi:hypothetical protein [Pseudarthrobacter sp. N5]|uniref:hypothetical protein n=1 Tax=Pseudarthrobacter sp. N5 TaxID=3418416 RepID=UPI003CF744BA
MPQTRERVRRVSTPGAGIEDVAPGRRRINGNCIAGGSRAAKVSRATRDGVVEGAGRLG